MSTTIQFPIRQRRQQPDGITGRDGYVAAQALVYAIEAISALPDWRQERSNARDMVRLLEHLVPSEMQRKYMTVSVRWHLFDAGQEPTTA